MCRGWVVYKDIIQEEIKTVWCRPWNTWEEGMLENAMLEEYKDQVNSIISKHYVELHNLINNLNEGSCQNSRVRESIHNEMQWAQWIIKDALSNFSQEVLDNLNLVQEQQIDTIYIPVESSA
ncbi:hypothetical protein CMK22_12475 [Candidatus Poribacteria bacterium]|nr:hypothetical protein [Candidatus Poribacteria bacterium]